MNKTFVTPIEDLREDALNHYDELATKACQFSSEIPKAINFYYDSQLKARDREKSFWGSAKLMLWTYAFIAVMTIAIAYWSRIS
jgi:hypothetical protein